MMTHTHLRISARISYPGTAVLNIDKGSPAEQFYYNGEVIYNSKAFDGFESGDTVEIVARVAHTEKSTRRYIIRVIKIAPLAATGLTAPTTVALSEEEVWTAAQPDGTVDNDPFGKAASQPIDDQGKSKIIDVIKNKIVEAASHFYVSPAQGEVFKMARQMMLATPERPVRVLMMGPSGYGKTSLPRFFAESTGMNYYRMNCAAVRDPEEWYGYRTAKDGTTSFQPNEFIKMVTAGNCVIVLDEMNRIEPWLANTLYPLLDDDASTVIYDEYYKVGPNVIFVMTINLGYEYAGTFNIDVALTNRVDLFCDVGPLPADEETKLLHKRYGIDTDVARKIVVAAASVRSLKVVECSTRTTLMIARAVAAGSSIRAAFQHIVIMRSTGVNQDDTRKRLLDAINSVLGVHVPQKFNGSFFS